MITDETYVDELAKFPEAKWLKLTMGTFEPIPLSPHEQLLEDLAKEYWDKCDAGWDYRRVKADILAHYGITHGELHKAIVAYGNIHRRRDDRTENQHRKGYER